MAEGSLRPAVLTPLLTSCGLLLYEQETEPQPMNLQHIFLVPYLLSGSFRRSCQILHCEHVPMVAMGIIVSNTLKISKLKGFWKRRMPEPHYDESIRLDKPDSLAVKVAEFYFAYSASILLPAFAFRQRCWHCDNGDAQQMLNRLRYACWL